MFSDGLDRFQDDLFKRGCLYEMRSAVIITTAVIAALEVAEGIIILVTVGRKTFWPRSQRRRPALKAGV